MIIDFMLIGLEPSGEFVPFPQFFVESKEFLKVENGIMTMYLIDTFHC